jgi:hypothetical protein
MWPFSYNDEGKQIKWLEKAYNKTRSLPQTFIGNLPTRIHRTADALRNYKRIKSAFKTAAKDMKRQRKRVKLQADKQSHLKEKTAKILRFSEESKKEKFAHIFNFRREKEILNDEWGLMKDEAKEIHNDITILQKEFRYAEKHLDKSYKLLQEEMKYMDKRILQFLEHKANSNIIASTQAGSHTDKEHMKKVQTARAKFKAAKKPKDFLQFMNDKEKIEVQKIFNTYEEVKRRLNIVRKHI